MRRLRFVDQTDADNRIFLALGRIGLRRAPATEPSGRGESCDGCRTHTRSKPNTERACHLPPGAGPGQIREIR